jgi:sugar diacid utilization regulator
MAQIASARLEAMPDGAAASADHAGAAFLPHNRVRAVHLEMVDAVLGRDGLARVVAIAARATGADIAIVAPRLGPPQVSAPAVDAAVIDALTAFVRDRARDRAARVPRCVVCEVPIVTGDETVGVVALLGSPTRGAPGDAVEVLHLAALAALTRLAIEEARHEVEEGLRSTFLEELRSASPPAVVDISRRALRLGCDLTHGAVVLCADGDPERPRLMLATVAADAPGALAQWLDGRLYAVLPAVEANDPTRSTLALAEAVAARLRRYGAVGISSFCGDPGELRLALDEAELMADVLKASGAPPAHDAGTGAYRLLLRLFVTHPDDVWGFYESTVAPLVRYDAHTGSDLVTTVERYLEQNCNMNATAAALFAHRHTIAYRLERVRELSGLDPSLSEHRERIGLGLKAYRILAPRVHLA